VSKEVVSSQMNINCESDLCVMNFFLSQSSKTGSPQIALLMALRD